VSEVEKEAIIEPVVEEVLDPAAEAERMYQLLLAVRIYMYMYE
jgi:hypothetical protein